MEFHPRIRITDLSLKTSKIILGSFPTWPLTETDNESTNEEKRLVRLNEGYVGWKFRLNYYSFKTISMHMTAPKIKRLKGLVLSTLSFISRT